MYIETASAVSQHGEVTHLQSILITGSHGDLHKFALYLLDATDHGMKAFKIDDTLVKIELEGEE